MEFRSCARIFRCRGSPAVGISLLRSNLQVEGLPSSWNSLLRVPLSESSTSLRVPPPESSTSLRVPPPGSSTPLGVPFPWEFHSSGNSTALGVPLLWSFTLLGVQPPGNSLVNPPVKFSQNSDPLTELSSLHAFNAWVHTSIYIYICVLVCSWCILYVNMKALAPTFTCSIFFLLHTCFLTQPKNYTCI